MARCIVPRSATTDVWLRRDRMPPEGSSLLGAALINPVPPTLRQLDETSISTVPIRSMAYNETTSGVPRGYMDHVPDPGSISLSALSRSAQLRYSVVRSPRSRLSVLTSW